MKNRRILYLLTGFMIMLLAGTVYTWTIIAKSISATYPDWSARTLSMTFTIDMMGYALGALLLLLAAIVLSFFISFAIRRPVEGRVAAH